MGVIFLCCLSRLFFRVEHTRRLSVVRERLAIAKALLVQTQLMPASNRTIKIGLIGEPHAGKSSFTNTIARLAGFSGAGGRAM